MRPASANAQGWDVHGLTDNTFTETGRTYANRPPRRAPRRARRDRSQPPAGTVLDITPLVTGNGSVNLVLKGTSNTQIDYGSREAATTKPKLIIQTAASGSDVEAPSAVGPDGHLPDRPASTAVTGYTIFRNGTPLPGTVGGSTTTFSDTALTAGTPRVRRRCMRRRRDFCRFVFTRIGHDRTAASRALS